MSLPAFDGRIEDLLKMKGLLKMEDKFLVLPEFYFSAEICGSIDTVLENRKNLEKCHSLHTWVTRVFGSDDFCHRKLFKTGVSERPPLRQRRLEIRQSFLTNPPIK
jgi:hypothetical protein